MVFTVGLLLVLALGVLWGSGSVATEQPGTAEPTLVVQVEPGDTLYDLAASITTDGDVNAMVERIEDLNRLESRCSTPARSCASRSTEPTPQTHN